MLMTMACQADPLAELDSAGAGSENANGGAVGEDHDAGAQGGDAPRAEPSGVALLPADGWLDGASNSLGVQGAAFAVADPASSLTSDFAGNKMCLKGTTARVDQECDAAPPGDCFSLSFGALLGLNLNQRLTSDGEVSDPERFDASAITGFAFDIEGPVVPSALRFGITSDEPELYCERPRSGQVADSHREHQLTELVAQCHRAGSDPKPASSAKHRAVRLQWQVVSNTAGEVPFDFCVTNLRALTE